MQVANSKFPMRQQYDGWLCAAACSRLSTAAVLERALTREAMAAINAEVEFVGSSRTT
jgi:hypothetical protein